MLNKALSGKTPFYVSQLIITTTQTAFSALARNILKPSCDILRKWLDTKLEVGKANIAYKFRKVFLVISCDTE